MMDDITRMLVPLLITALGVVVFQLYGDVKHLETVQAEAHEYIYRIEQLETKVEELRKDE